MQPPRREGRRRTSRSAIPAHDPAFSDHTAPAMRDVWRPGASLKANNGPRVLLLVQADRRPWNTVIQPNAHRPTVCVTTNKEFASRDCHLHRHQEHDSEQHSKGRDDSARPGHQKAR